jgi:hypothetical protein
MLQRQLGELLWPVHEQPIADDEQAAGAAVDIAGLAETLKK